MLVDYLFSKARVFISLILWKSKGKLKRVRTI